METKTNKMIMTEEENYYHLSVLNSIITDIKAGKKTVQDLKDEAKRLMSIYNVIVSKKAKTLITITNICVYR